MNRRQTVAKLGLFVFFVLIVLSLGPASAQQPEEPKATPQTATQAGPEEVAPSLTSTPAAEPAESAEATQGDASAPKRPKTIGEVLLGEGPEAAHQGQGEQRLNFPPKKAPRRDWAASGEVGESTFVDKLVRVGWSLALISFLVWALAKLAGKAGLKQIGVGPSPRSLIEVLEKKRFSPGRSIMVVRVGPKVLAVAATESGYETLTEFDGDQFKAFQDGLVDPGEVEADESPPEATTPLDIARHYLSIIPGTGAKK